MYKNSTKNLGLPQYDVQDYFQPITDLNPAFEKIDNAIGESKKFSAEMERRVTETENDIVNLTGRVNALRTEHDADHAVLNGLKDWEEEAKGKLENLRTDVDENISDIAELIEELSDEIQRAKNAEGDLGVRISAANVAAAEAQVAAGRAEKAATDANEAAQQAKVDANTASTKAEEAASSAEEAQESSSQAVEKANEVAQSVTDITANLGTIQDNLKNKPNYNGYVNPDTEGTYENPVNTPLKIMSEKYVAVTDIPPGKYVYDTAYINGIETANSASIQALTTQQTQLGAKLNNFDTELDSLGTRVESNEDSLTNHDSRIQLVESGLKNVNKEIEELQIKTIDIKNVYNVQDIGNGEVAVVSNDKYIEGSAFGIRASDGNGAFTSLTNIKDEMPLDTDRIAYNTYYINSLETTLRNDISSADTKAQTATAQAAQAISDASTADSKATGAASAAQLAQTQIVEIKKELQSVSSVANAANTSASSAKTNITNLTNRINSRWTPAPGVYKLPYNFPATNSSGGVLVGVIVSALGGECACTGFLPNNSGAGNTMNLPFFAQLSNRRIAGSIELGLGISSAGMNITKKASVANVVFTIANPPVAQVAETYNPNLYGYGLYL